MKQPIALQPGKTCWMDEEDGLRGTGTAPGRMCQEGQPWHCKPNGLQVHTGLWLHQTDLMDMCWSVSAGCGGER